MLAELNWISLHYPHFGGPTTGPYHGPPILLVLLNFGVFLYLVWRFVWPMIVRYAEKRHEAFLKEYTRAQKAYEEALRAFREAENRRKQAFAIADDLARRILEHANREAVEILKQAEEYVRIRMQETERQASVKRERALKELHDEIMREVIREAVRMARQMATDEDRRRLYALALKHMGDEVGRRAVNE